MDAPRRICVVMGDTRPVYGDERAWSSYPSLTFAINERFARQCGWDFRYEQYQIAEMPWGKLEAYSTAAGQHRAPTWVKLMAVDQALELGYEAVLWIDTDCIFYNHAADWSDILVQLSTHNFVGWADKPFNDNDLCAGFFAVRNRPEVRNLLKALWLKPSMFHWKQFHEQTELNAFFRRSGPEWLWLIDEPMFSLESESQRLYHIASFDTLLRIPKFTEWLVSRNLGPASAGVIDGMVYRTLDVDLYDLKWSGIEPGALDRIRRILWSLRSFGRRTAKKIYRSIRPLK
jgi:hypothetical protein